MTASIQIRKPENENHHLYCIDGRWNLSYTIHPDSLTKERVRKCLGKISAEEARAERDRIFKQLGL